MFDQFKIYPISNTLVDEFEDIKAILETFSLFEPGKEAIQNIQPTCDKIQIERSLKTVSEYKNLLETGTDCLQEQIPDIRKELSILHAQNGVLNQDSFIKLIRFIKITEDVFQFLEIQCKDHFAMRELGKNYVWKGWVKVKILEVFSEDGVIRSDASDELKSIKKRQQQTYDQVTKEYQRVINRLGKLGWLTSSVESSRNSRKVLSIHAEHRRSIKGIIHDVSASGRTVFFEPDETIELNKKMFELQQEEKMEIFKILRSLCNTIRIECSSLFSWIQLLTEFDVVRAKAKKSILIKGNEPLVVDIPQLSLQEAVHPLLFLHQKNLHKKTVSFDLELNNESRMLIISGPNAGGKTMCMKAAALLQMMLQAGMHVSASGYSQFGIFSHVMVDIGDNQSIQYELSTYSSRMEYMNYFLSNADENTLLIIDELGSGTDPQIGSALAESMLRHLVDKGTKGIVTTHYPNLKLLATNQPYFSNANVSFDIRNFKPLYTLEHGKPGSSYALLLAERSGISEQIIDEARSRMSEPALHMEKLLTQLQLDATEATELMNEAAIRNKQLGDLIEKYQQLISKELKREEKNEFFLGKKEKQIIRENSDRMKKFYKEFKAAKNKSYVIKKYERYFDDRKKQVAPEITEEEQTYHITVGMKVRMKKGKVSGLVESIDDKKVRVVFGQLRMNCNISDLIPDEIGIKKNKH